MAKEESNEPMELEAVLRPPGEAQNLSHRWEELSAGDALFAALRRKVAEGALGQATEWIDEWQSLLPRVEARVDWEIAAGLVWCAEQAVKAPRSLKAPPSAGALKGYLESVELERCCFAIHSRGYASESLRDWAWGCIRTFLDAPTRSRVLHIPAAAWRERGNEGLLLTLQLELLEGGTGGIFHHPKDAFVTKVDGAFNDSMREAWQAACRLARVEGAALHCDGRWRVLSGWTWDKAKRAGLAPVKLASEQSASGAAARGWWFALSNKVPDEEVVVLAQSDASGTLGPVTGTAAKVLAIAELGGFDTVAVTTENVAAAHEALKVADKLGAVRVVDIADPQAR